MAWTADQTTELAALCARGWTAAAIATQLGVSRDQVIGKCRRAGLKLAHPPNRKGVSKVSIDPFSRSRGGLKRLPPVARGNQPFVHVTPFTAPPGRGCKWPHPDFIQRIRAREEPFCNAPTQEGSSWCPHHRAKVYVRAFLTGRNP